MTEQIAKKVGRYVSRMAEFTRLSSGKKVLHLGCSSGRYIDDRIARGTFLHETLSRSAEHLSGLDLDALSLSKMEALGYTNLYHGNAERLDEVKLDAPYDLIVAGDLLEHITRPGAMLDTAKPLLAQGGQIRYFYK